MSSRYVTNVDAAVMTQLHRCSPFKPTKRVFDDRDEMKKCHSTWWTPTSNIQGWEGYFGNAIGYSYDPI